MEEAPEDGNANAEENLTFWKNVWDKPLNHNLDASYKVYPKINSYVNV